MQYRLSTLLIVMGAAPPMLALAWHFLPFVVVMLLLTMLGLVYSVAMGIVIGFATERVANLIAGPKCLRKPMLRFTVRGLSS